MTTTKNTPSPNWIKYPKTIHLILFITSWFASIALLAFAITDAFTQSPFSWRYSMIYLMIIGSTWATVEITINYFKNKK